MAASRAGLLRLRTRRPLPALRSRLLSRPRRLPGWLYPVSTRPRCGERASRGAHAQTSAVLGRYLARRLSHEPRARSAPPPPRQAVNEALPATWGASSTWCSGRQSRLRARPAECGLRRARPRRQVKTDGLSVPQQVLRGPLAPGPPPEHPLGAATPGIAPSLARPPVDGGSPCLAASAWHSKELDRLVLASAGRHLLGSPALVSQQGSLRCPSEVFSRSGAKPASLLNGGG